MRISIFTEALMPGSEDRPDDAINVNLKANLANGHFHLLTAIEVKVMRINSLLFWVQHWTDALAKVGA